jgi:hypothetical protein
MKWNVVAEDGSNDPEQASSTSQILVSARKLSIASLPLASSYSSSQLKRS